MRRHLAALVVVLVAAVASAAPAKWYESYRKGVAAAQGRDWATAVEQIELAVAQKPTEAYAAPTTRNQTIEYVPHFWLGVARFNMGDIEGATREWDVSQAQGVIQRTQNYSVLQSYRAQARSLLDKKTSEKASESRRAADAALKKALSSRMMAMTAGADRLESYRAAGRRLEEARDKFNGAGNDIATYREAAKIAGEAEAMYTASAQEARAAKSARAATPPPVRTTQRRPSPSVVAQQPAAAPAQAPVQTVPVAAQPQEQPAVAKVEVEAPEQKQPRLSTQFIVARDAVTRIETKLNSARARGASDPDFTRFLSSARRSVDGWQRELGEQPDDGAASEIEGEVTALERRLADELKRLARTTPPQELEKGLVKAQMLNAYVAFAEGKMEQADGQLTALIRTHPEVAEAFLLRGCARYTQSVLTRNASLQKSAESDFAAALRLRPNIGLDSRHFSPKLIAALREVRARGK